MRRAAVLCLCAGLMACGGSSKSSSSGPGPSGAPSGPGPSSVAVTGANNFIAANAIGYSTTTPASCTYQGVPVATAFLAAFVTDVQADVCALVNAHQEKKGAGSVGVVISRGNAVPGGTPSAIGPGTYAITASGATPAPDAHGDITFVAAFASKNAAGSCGATDVEAESGTVTITSVSNGVISGTIDASLPAAKGGGKITGPFTTTSCALTATDVCGDATGNTAPSTCVD